jgi:hypothetical protein
LLVTSGKSPLVLRPSPHLTGGAYRDRHGRWARDAVGAAVHQTNASDANDEAVWS